MRSILDNVYTLAETLLARMPSKMSAYDTEESSPAPNLILDDESMDTITTPALAIAYVNSIQDQSTSLQELDNLWAWSRLPYLVRWAAEEHGRSRHKLRNTTDEWCVRCLVHFVSFELTNVRVLRNENFLRLVQTQLERQSMVRRRKLRRRLSTYGLISLDTFALTVPHARNAQNRLIIQRESHSLDDFVVLSDLRPPAISIPASSTAFQNTWDILSGGLLDHLDWKNVAIAGGIVVGALISPTADQLDSMEEEERTRNMKAWEQSDIDLYLYGLSPADAVEKLHHIGETYRRNLPAGMDMLAVRTSQTVTFYSKWPTRRLQIILKLCKSPTDVLLNFDLDVCAVAFDGTTVWMLPRFIRALESMSFAFLAKLH